ALRLLAQGAHGSMRDALSLTDQAIAYAAGKVTLEAVQGMLGALDQSYLVRLLDGLANKDGADLLAVADEMATRSLSYNAALQDLATLLHRIALAQTLPSAVPDDVPEREEILRLATAFEPEEIQLFYQIAVHGRNELGLAPDEYAGFSMTLLRMLAFRPGMGADDAPPSARAPVAQIARPVTARSMSGTGNAAASASAALSVAPQAALASTPVARPGISPARAALEAARGGKAGVRTATQAVNTPFDNEIGQAATNYAAAPLTHSAPPWETDTSSPAPEVNSQPVSMQESSESQVIDIRSKRPAAVTPETDLDYAASVPNTPKPAGKMADDDVPYILQPIPGLQWDGNWPALAAQLPVRGVAQQLALQAELIKCEHDSDGAQFHVRVPIETLRSSSNVDKLAAALTEHFSQPVRVTSEIGLVRHTASQEAQAQRDARQRQAEHAIQDDPFVQDVMREFGATLVQGSVKPVSAVDAAVSPVIQTI
ncbi:MAG: DNA polymerase III subunit gamma/tau C-terminal domain-containing protein, partial [Pseudomonadota bacterium]